MDERQEKNWRRSNRKRVNRNKQNNFTRIAKWRMRLLYFLLLNDILNGFIIQANLFGITSRSCI